jgi:hypothetical protein
MPQNPAMPGIMAQTPALVPAKHGINACSATVAPRSRPPTLWDALNANYLYLEVRCLGCDTHQTVVLNIIRRPKTTPIHVLELHVLERYMRCGDCSEVRRYPYKRSHLVALRPNKISALDPPSVWWPGER